MRRIGFAFYWWVAGQFSLSTVRYMGANKAKFNGWPKVAVLASPFLTGALWPLVVLCAIPGLVQQRKLRAKAGVPEAKATKPNLSVVPK